jgi:hypothetical protein
MAPLGEPVDTISKSVGWCLGESGSEEREVLSPFLFKLGHWIGEQCVALERWRPKVENVVAVDDQRYSSCGKDC